MERSKIPKSQLGMWSKKSKRRYCFGEQTQMSTPRISPTLFDDGAVGLRIVAAMSVDSIESSRVAMGKARSDPIQIRGRVGPTVRPKEEEGGEDEDGDDDVELSESYTCVISRLGGGTVRKRVYLDGGGGDDDRVGVVVVDGIGGNFEMNSGVFFESPPSVGPTSGGFLGRCYLCRKKLHGLDIFMYRGESFCSAECRCQQILNDEHKEKCRPEARKRHDSPLSPYLAPLPYDAGVAAA